VATRQASLEVNVHRRKQRREKVYSQKEMNQMNQMNQKSHRGKREWTDAEMSALVQYICLFWDNAISDKWPMQRDPEFWDACASAVNKACSSSRTGW